MYLHWYYILGSGDMEGSLQGGMEAMGEGFIYSLAVTDLWSNVDNFGPCTCILL